MPVIHSKSNKKMPTATIVKHELERLLGIKRSDEEFEAIFADLGMELDEIVMLPERFLEEQGPVKHYRVDVTANRPDILSVEGMAATLQPFLGLGEPLGIYAKDSSVHIKVDGKAVGPVRPYIVSAIVRDVKFTQTSFNSFIDYQDKLHHNLCRKRTLVAIGTHDLDNIDTSSITYSAQPPEDIVFTALSQSEAMDGRSLFQVLEKDRQLSSYLHIIQNEPMWPVIRDGRGEVLSLPPIINSEYSKVSLQTTNVFIECTATDLGKACATLNSVINSIRMHTRRKNQVETVSVIYDSLTSQHAQLRARKLPAKVIYPLISSCQLELRLAKLSEVSGIPLDALTVSTVFSYLKRMSIRAEVARAGTSPADTVLRCYVPFFRQDIIAEADLIENFCISYGYNTIAEEYAKLPGTMTQGSTLQDFRLGETMRAEAVACGYIELVLFSLCPAEDSIFGDLPVELSNTKTAMFSHARSSLAPGLLRAASAHQHASLPIKLFEVSEVLMPNTRVDDDVGIHAVKKFSCIYGGTTDGFEIVHGLLDHLMKKLAKSFKLVGEDHPTCLPGRRASITVDDRVIGWIGVIHPNVLLSYKVPIPCTVVEFLLN